MTPRVLAGSGKYGEHVCADFKAWVAFLSAGDALDGGQDRVDRQTGGQRFACFRIERVVAEVERSEHRTAADIVSDSSSAIDAETAARVAMHSRTHTTSTTTHRESTRKLWPRS